MPSADRRAYQARFQKDYRTRIEAELPAPQGGMAWSAEDKERLLELRKQGLKMYEIAAELGRSYASVRYKAHELSVKSKTTPRREP